MKISHGNHHLHETGTCKFTRDVKCHDVGACKFMRDVKCHDTYNLHGDVWSWAHGNVRTKRSTRIIAQVTRRCSCTGYSLNYFDNGGVDSLESANYVATSYNLIYVEPHSEPVRKITCLEDYMTQQITQCAMFKHMCNQATRILRRCV